MMERLFFAIPLPDNIKNLIGALQEPAKNVRWADSSHMHVTLKFLGNATSEQKGHLLDEARTIRIRPFSMRIAGVGRFGSRVLWAGIDAPAELMRLQAQVEAAAERAGFPPEDRPFHPHVTLARLQRPVSRWLKPYLERHRAFQTDFFDVTDFVLVRSTLLPRGALYDVQESIPLTA